MEGFHIIPDFFFSPVFIFSAILITVFLIAAMRKVFTKEGRPGWASIIPIYNIYVMIKIAGKPGTWLLWMITRDFICLSPGGVVDENQRMKCFKSAGQLIKRLSLFYAGRIKADKTKPPVGSA